MDHDIEGRLYLGTTRLSTLSTVMLGSRIYYLLVVAITAVLVFIGIWLPSLSPFLSSSSVKIVKFLKIRSGHPWTLAAASVEIREEG